MLTIEQENIIRQELSKPTANEFVRCLLEAYSNELENLSQLVLPDKCVNCEYARQACADEYIGCAYWTKIREEALQGLEGDINLDIFERRLMRDCEIQGVARGWVFLSRRPEHEQTSTDTVSQSLMTNDVYVFKKDFCCKYFKNR